MESKKELVKLLFDRGLLLKPELFSSLTELEIERTLSEAKQGKVKDIEEFVKELRQNKIQINIGERKSDVNIVYNYKDTKKKRQVADFVDMFRHRYASISKILRNRKEFQNVMSINKIANKKPGEEAVIIGMVNDIRESKGGHTILKIEDTTGFVNVLVNKTKKELFETAKEVVQDEVIGIVGTCGEGIIFAKTIQIPDVPATKEYKKYHDEVYMAIISDIHAGTKALMKEEFLKFISWLNGEVGTEEQRNTG